ncbi:unnamed protein product [Rotaria sordida]|uniref:AP-3 complex subunit beta-1/2 C-terminal domain-containing protein n=1 Tax=Rotaria sordida TaxID=392033 RepID=A0A814HFF3_9BILA|nr:unnamed protein product [Rotaria sordida]
MGNAMNHFERFPRKSTRIYLFFSNSFSGQTISSESLILLTIQLNILQSIINLTINPDRIIRATMLLNDIKQTLSIQEVLKETESMISHTKNSFIKSWEEFQDVYNTANNDNTLKQSKQYEEAQKIYDEINKADQEDRLIDACQREIGQLTTRINELTQLYMANQITNAQTVELGQAVGRKYFAQLELDKLNAANQTTVAGSG